MKCGLLGRKLGHSYSPQIHKYLGSYAYALYEKEPEALQQFLKETELTGLNVTIPYKKAVIPFCDALSPTAQKLGAVNTIVRRDGRLIGHNTDHFGFSSMIAHSGLSVRGKKVLVLGNGGASATAQCVLRELGADMVVISRRGENHYGNLHLHRDARIIVNCTPVGMYPETGTAPLDIGQFPLLEGVLDMIYNPARTQLLLDAEKRGLVAENGLWMLVAQAKESAQWFLDTTLPDELIATIHGKLRRQMENIVLIGMPGCGKSTVARELGTLTGRTVVDADAQIEAFAGCTVPELFARGGEAEFRSIETKVLAQLGKRSGIVLATGGGCVTRAENYPLLHQNGTIIWITRELSRLPTDGRPLSAKGSLEEMYRVREPMYRSFADSIVDNGASPEQAAKTILSILEQE